MTRLVVTVTDVDAKALLVKIKNLKGVKSVKEEKLKPLTNKDWILPSKRKATDGELREMIKKTKKSPIISAEEARKQLDSVIRKIKSRTKAA